MTDVNALGIERVFLDVAADGEEGETGRLVVELTGGGAMGRRQAFQEALVLEGEAAAAMKTEATSGPWLMATTIGVQLFKDNFNPTIEEGAEEEEEEFENENLMEQPCLLVVEEEEDGCIYSITSRKLPEQAFLWKDFIILGRLVGGQAFFFKMIGSMEADVENPPNFKILKTGLLQRKVKEVVVPVEKEEDVIDLGDIQPSRRDEEEEEEEREREILRQRRKKEEFLRLRDEVTESKRKAKEEGEEEEEEEEEKDELREQYKIGVKPPDEVLNTATTSFLLRDGSGKVGAGGRLFNRQEGAVDAGGRKVKGRGAMKFGGGSRTFGGAYGGGGGGSSSRYERDHDRERNYGRDRGGDREMGRGGYYGGGGRDSYVPNPRPAVGGRRSRGSGRNFDEGPAESEGRSKRGRSNHEEGEEEDEKERMEKVEDLRSILLREREREMVDEGDIV